VTIADGNTLHYQFVRRRFKLLGIEFVFDMLLLPLGSCDLVLGFQWLSTLGVIKWDFKHLRIEFTYQGHPVTLKGVRVQKPQVLPQEQLCKALKTASQLFMLHMLPESEG